MSNFYESFRRTAKMVEHLRRKRKREPCPSDVDMSLLLYLKDMGAPIVTNDSDFICFTDELRAEGFMFWNIDGSVAKYFLSVCFYPYFQNFYQQYGLHDSEKLI